MTKPMFVLKKYAFSFALTAVGLTGSFISTNALATESFRTQTSIANFPTPQRVPLVRPIAVETLQRLFSEAESFYKAQMFKQSYDSLLSLLELEPDYAPAWLRLGNVWQTENRIEFAIKAYSIAAEPNEGPSYAENVEARAKALLNLANLHLQRSRLAIDTYRIRYGTEVADHQRSSPSFSQVHESLTQEHEQNRAEIEEQMKSEKERLLRRTTRLTQSSTAQPIRATQTVQTFIGKSR